MNSEDNKPISVIVSPFFPFNRIFSNEIVYSLFGDIQYEPTFLDYSTDTTYDEFVLKISQIIIHIYITFQLKKQNIKFYY